MDFSSATMCCAEIARTGDFMMMIRLRSVFCGRQFSSNLQINIPLDKPILFDLFTFSFVFFLFLFHPWIGFLAVTLL